MPAKNLPGRWAELDSRTIEMIARLNEPERRNLIHVANLNDKELKRLDHILTLPDEEFEAGLHVMTTVVRVRWLVSRSVWLIGAAAAAVIAWRQLAALWQKG